MMAGMPSHRPPAPSRAAADMVFGSLPHRGMAGATLTRSLTHEAATPTTAGTG